MDKMYNFSLHASREKEFPNLNEATYVDHAGTTLYSKSQMDAVHKDLTSNLYGNPHSHHYSSKLATDSLDQIRYRLLRFFNASPDEYSLIFTSGCTAALKMLAHNFNFSHNAADIYGGSQQQQPSTDAFCFLQDNHTSVQGMRGQMTFRGVKVACLDEEEVEAALALGRLMDGGGEGEKEKKKEDCEPPAFTTTTTSSSSSPSSSSSSSSSLFVYPAQSNFSGKRYPTRWVNEIRTHGLCLSHHSQDPGSGGDSASWSSPSSWYVCLDAASLVSTSVLHLDRIKPDFVTVSFYKIFGYPTGLGCLLVHRRASHLLDKTYFGGGTVAASTAKESFQVFRKSLHERFEDGTLPFLSIISLRHGLDALQKLTGDMERVSGHVYCVAQYFHQHLTHLRHGNGQPLACVYGGLCFQDPQDQGGIVTFNLQRADGQFIGYAEVDKFAQLHDVHLRTGCFCNIGACQKYLYISSKSIKDNLDAGHVCGDNLDLIEGRPTGAVRISFGYMSTLEDARCCLRFITDSFLEEVSPMPSFPLPLWWQQQQQQQQQQQKQPQQQQEAKTQLNKDGGGSEEVFDAINKGQGDVTVTSVKGQGDVTVTSVKGQGDTTTMSSTPALLSPTPGGENGGGDGSKSVTDIFLYPLKSCGAFRVREWQMGTRGLLYDREWVLVTDAGVTVGQRREPKICLIGPVIDLAARTLTLNFPGETPFQLSLDLDEDAYATATLCNNKVCGDRVNTFDCGDAVADWLSNVLQRPGIRLLRQLSEDTRTSKQKDKGKGSEDGSADEQRLSLANESQMLLLNRASVRALQAKMATTNHHGNQDADDSAMPTTPHDVSEDNLVLRFRGNLVVDCGLPFEEETWERLAVGENTVVLQNVCSRCSMICMDQNTGEKSREPLRTLAVWRGKKVPFGVHSRMLPRKDGSRQLVRVGDCISVL